MRLIDRDSLKHQIIETYEYEFPTASGAFDEFVTKIIPNIINNAPTIDAVPVVRCKDCQSFRPYPKPVEDFDGFCIQRGCETDEKEFCSYPVNKREYDAKMDEEEKQ